MQNKTPIWRSTARLLRRVYHTVNNYRNTFKDVDFRAFSTLEYPKVISEEVKDLKRLEYIKKLDLAKNGYIDGNLKNLLAQGKEKERLVRNDHKIVTIGNFQVLENDTLLCLIKFGFQPNTQTFFMANNTHDNIPLWKKYDVLGLRESVSVLHPSKNSTLKFEHSFYGTDNSQDERKDNGSIATFYNNAVQLAFHSNLGFKASILLPNEEVVSDPIRYVGKQFDLSEPEGGYSIMTLTEATERYLVFQSFLEMAPKAESFYFSIQEFKERFLDSKIELIAILKHGLKLGVLKGSLYISRNKRTDANMKLPWEAYEKRMQSSELSAKEKLYLSKEVIIKKNFVIEKDAVVLKNNGRKAYLKKHYGTGQWRFAEAQKNQDNLNFRPVDQSMLGYIRNHYTPRNLGITFEQIRKATKEQTLKIQ